MLFKKKSSKFSPYFRSNQVPKLLIAPQAFSESSRQHITLILKEPNFRLGGNDNKQRELLYSVAAVLYICVNVEQKKEFYHHISGSKCYTTSLIVPSGVH